MKRIIIASMFAVLATSAFAGATYELKAGDGDYTGTHVDYDKNAVGYYSSDSTGNGGTVGGNGDAWNGAGSPDQTTTPGSRGDTVQDLQSSQGRGRDD